jgi:hypothetical protein
MPTSPTDAVLAELSAAAAGLLVLSESDYPLEPYRWDGAWPPTPAALSVALGAAPDATVEERSVAGFFAAQARTYDWQDDAERERAARFAALGALVAARLADPRLYRIGDIEITVLILGRVGDEIVGLRTTVVET